MKTVLINAITVKEGGAIVVLTHLLEKMQCISNNIRWVIVIDECIKKDILTNDTVVVLTFPWVKKSIFHLLFWYEVTLPLLVRKYHVDCLFSQTNMLSQRSLSCPSLLLLHNAGFFSDEFKKMQLAYEGVLVGNISWMIRKYLIDRSIKKSTHITVQTNALANAILKSLPLQPEKITVISHGAGVAKSEYNPRQYPVKKIWKIGYISLFRPYKNFEVLLGACEKLRKTHPHFKLVLTLDESHPSFKAIQSLINYYSLQANIENVGLVDISAMPALYESLDIFVFPSLCESLGLPLIEAMNNGLPIIASAIESNREILGDQGDYFEPHNASALKKKIIDLMLSHEKYEKQSAYFYDRSHLYSWDTAAVKTVELLESIIVGDKS